MSRVLRRVAAALLLVVPLSVTLAAAQGQVPTPQSVLGFPVGADFELASYDESLEYFRALDAASDRVQLVEVGRTSLGNPWYIALISSAENLAQVDRYRDIAQRLAHPDGLDDAEARRLAREGKAIVHIDGGLHSTETAHGQHTIQLAYDLVSGDDDPEIAAILDNVVLVLWFSINPDGQNMVVDWYEQNLGTPYETSRPPFLYQKYVGHDNNRDGYMINMLESRVVTRVDREWEPQILYNHHQTAPTPATIWIPPFAEPISPYVHPLMWRTVNLLGMNMGQALEERNLPGAVHMGTGFDDWYPGFLDHANNFHNVAAFLTETGQHGSPTPRFYTLRDFPEQARELRPQSLYASPWKGGWWRLSDSVEYMLTASMSVLDFAAKFKEDVLYNRYQAGRDVIDTHRREPPFIYFVRRQQRDPAAAVEMLRRLAYNGVDVYELGQEITYEGQTFPAGTWAVPMDQEFANFVRQLFAIQEYPDLRRFPEGPPDQPYDVAGWTLPLQMDVAVVEGHTPIDEGLRSSLSELRTEPLSWDADVGDAAPFDSVPGVGFDDHPVAAAILPLEGRATGSGSALAVDPAQNNSFKALNRAWAQGGRVAFEAGSPGEEGEPGSSGRYVISDLGAGAVDALVDELHLQAARTGGGGSRMSRPRVGVYRPWAASMDEGWTRWLLDSYGFEYRSLRNSEVQAGSLRDRYDVILLADMSAGHILEGNPDGTVPPRYAGGIGDEGVRALEEFVHAGGTLVCMNDSSQFAIDELHLPVRNVVADLDDEEFSVSGSVLRAEVDPSHPVMSGMPARAKLMVADSPVFTTEEGFQGRVMARYPKKGSPLLSGYLLGPEHLQGYAAAVDVRHGGGRVVLLGFRPQWRGQPFGTFKVLFNSLLYTDEVADAVADVEAGFWMPPVEGEESAPTDEAEGR